MAPTITGIHHVTAFAKDPRTNLAFCSRILGLRLVKRTVNFDDPLTWHLYFGDGRGSPGTLVTTFPSPRLKRGTHGVPEIAETVLAVPPGGLDAWERRLATERIAAERRQEPLGPRLAFEDENGLRFSLAESATAGPPDAIAGIDSVVLRVSDPGEVASFLEGALGFARGRQAGDRLELTLGEGGAGRRVEVLEAPAANATAMGAGIVHHVAWRVPDDDAQAHVAGRLRAAGLTVTPVMDRQYFRSVYCRVPGGVIFEFATDGPGFEVDEEHAALGASLKLPPEHEPRRAEIEAALPALE